MMKKTLSNIRVYFFLLTFIATSSIVTANNKRSNLLTEAIKSAEQRDYANSFELLEQCLENALAANDYHELFWVHTNLAINRAELLDYNTAIEDLMNAYEVATNHLESNYEMSVLNNIAGIYMMDAKYEKANDYYKTVYNRIKEGKDSLFIGGSAMNITMCYSNMNQHDEAEKYLQIALRMLSNNPTELLRARLLHIIELREKGQFGEAEELGRNLLSEIDELDYNSLKPEICCELIKIYLAKHQYDDAYYYTEQSLQENLTVTMRLNVYLLLDVLLKEKGDFEALVSCRDSILLLDQHINDARKQKQTELAQIKFEILKNKKDLAQSKSKLINILIDSFIVGIIILCLIFVLLERAKKQKQRQHIMQLKLEQEIFDKQILEDDLNTQRNRFLVNQERMKYEQDELIYELELKNKELTSQAIYIAKRNELIEDLVDLLSQIETNKHDEKLNHNILQLKRYLKSNKEWDSFLTHFEQSNQKFITSLKALHPDLSVNEIRFLSFVYLNLNNNEIGILMNIAPESCKKKRWILAKKMNLTGGTALHNYLCSL